MKNKEISKKQWFFLIKLGLPSSGIALAYTFVTMYLPIFIEHLSGATATGIIISGEGFFAIFIPFFVGSWSDSLQNPLGRRLPFVFSGTAILFFSLVLMLLSKNSLIGLCVALGLFYIAYYTYFAAYYAFFPDLVVDEQRGRSQGVQGGFRSLGMFLALVGGGFLLHIWEPLPFIMIALIILLETAMLYYTVRPRIKTQNTTDINWLSEWTLVYRNPKIRIWFIANSLWEAAIGVLRVFIVLYFTHGVGFTLSETASSLSLVGISAIIAAPLAGKLADRYSHSPVILSSLIFFTLGLLPPLFTLNPYWLAGILPVAFSAVILMTLPYSLLMGYLPKEKMHGAAAALFILSQGIGVIIGPLLAGLAIDLSQNLHLTVFAKTHGYAMMFAVASLFLAISIPFTYLLFKTSNN